MTTKRIHGPIEYRTGIEHRGREVVLTLYPHGLIGARHLGSRTEYTVPLGAVFDLGARLYAAEHAAQRKGGKV